MKTTSTFLFSQFALCIFFCFHLPGAANKLPFRELHHLMTADELRRAFSISSSDEVPKYEVAIIRMRRGNNEATKGPVKRDYPGEISLDVLGSSYELRLKRNKHLSSPYLRIVRTGEDGREERLSQTRPCHYLGTNKDGGVLAALDDCNQDGISGYLLSSNNVVRVSPVPVRLRSAVESEEGAIPHLAYLPQESGPNISAVSWDDQYASPSGAYPFAGGFGSEYEYAFGGVGGFGNGLGGLSGLGGGLPGLGGGLPGLGGGLPGLGGGLPGLGGGLPGLGGGLGGIPGLGGLGRPGGGFGFGGRLPGQGGFQRPFGLGGFGGSFRGFGDAPGGYEKKKRGSKDKYLELAVFVDQAAYELFMPFVGAENKLQELILGYVNQIQALYYQPSLGEKLTIVLVRLELQKKQPSDLPHHDGERDKLLSSFCQYQQKKNTGSDKDGNHWDMALYVSGLNFYGMEKGQKNYITMGLAPVGGVCKEQYGCVIAEFGVMNEQGKPYPSAGLMATYVAAHEIGHNLGMMHDGTPSNDCDSNGFVMSASRGTKGETTWSKCSATLLKGLDKDCLFDKPGDPPKADDHHTMYKELPGQVWDAYDQCRIFTRDNEAMLYNDTVIESVCEQTLCRSPRRMGYYSAGPALDGTFCGDGKWCRDGKCVAWGSGEKPPVVPGGWSEWSNGKCISGCVKDAMGTETDTRTCTNPKPKNTRKVCDGEPIRIKLCDDQKLCSGARQTAEKYASAQCAKFAATIPDVTAEGTQVPYNEARAWAPCAVYCKLKTGTWYTPVQESSGNLDPYFPDGTKCHNDGKKDFYCQNHVCQPAAKGRAIQVPGAGGQVDILTNARPGILERLREYFRWTGSEGGSQKLPKDLTNPDDDVADHDDTILTS